MDAGWGLKITMITLTKHLACLKLKLHHLIVTTILKGRYHHFLLFTDQELQTKANLLTVIERVEPEYEPRESDDRACPHNHICISTKFLEKIKSKSTESYLLDSSKLLVQLFQLVSNLLHRLLQIFQLLQFSLFLWTILKCVRIK